jgi:hypothetical protein
MRWRYGGPARSRHIARFYDLGRMFTYAEVVYITNPLALGGVGFSSLLSFIHSLPYAAAIVDSHARLRARKILLNVERLPEAVDSIARGERITFPGPWTWARLPLSQ